MRKHLYLISLIASLVVISLAGCSGEKAKKTESTETATEKKYDTETEAVTEKAIEKSQSTNSHSSSSTKTVSERVKCSMCNGTGTVKYYYGESALEAALNGHDDYEFGPCSTCDGTGYTTVRTTAGSGSSASNKKTCPSCGKKVSSLSTRKDAAGVSRTWCSSCWSDYNSIMG